MVVTVLLPREIDLLEKISVLDIVGTFTPHAWNLPVPFGTTFTFILVELPVAVSVIVPVPPAYWK